MHICLVGRHSVQMASLARTLQGTGQSIAGPCAAKSLQNAASALSTTFELHGRGQAWGCADPKVCTPCNSELVKAFCAGYLKTTAKAGHEPIGAVPFSKDKAILILKRLCMEALQPIYMGVQHVTTEQVLAARDGLDAFAWTAACRCINSCELRIENFTIQSTGRLAAPLRRGAVDDSHRHATSWVGHQRHTRLPSQAQPVTNL